MVLFENGTCVTLAEPGADPAARGTTVLREFGSAGLRSSAADFAGTVEMPDGSGWVVASRNADINTFVSRGELRRAPRMRRSAGSGGPSESGT